MMIIFVIKKNTHTTQREKKFNHTFWQGLCITCTLTIFNLFVAAPTAPRPTSPHATATPPPPPPNRPLTQLSCGLASLFSHSHVKTIACIINRMMMMCLILSKPIKMKETSRWYICTRACLFPMKVQFGT